MMKENETQQTNKVVKKKLVLQSLRLLVQIIFFIYLPALYVQALNGVRQIGSAIVQQNFSAQLMPQVIEIIAIIPITIILGRFFCGWMCGFGSFTDFIYLISTKVLKKKIRVNQRLDAVLKYVKYLLLAVLVVVVWNLDLTIFDSVSPWDVFGMVAIVGNMPDFSYVLLNCMVGCLILIGIIIASAFVERFFCRYLCPMGAVFAIASKLRIGKISKPSEGCGNCRICTNQCAMGIALYESDVIQSSECINCMKCVSACPKKNATYTIAKKDMRPFLVSVLSVAIMTASYYTTNYAINAAESSQVSSEEISQTSSEEISQTSSEEISQTSSEEINQTSMPISTNQLYIDGIYEGSGIGFRGETTTVEVTIEDDQITNITTVSYGDDRPYYDRAYSSVSQDIISSQSCDVDSVSGATYSSNGIKEAVENALADAIK